MESEEVDAVRVLSTGESARRDRKTKMDDFNAFAPEDRVNNRQKLIIDDVCTYERLDF